MQPLKNDWRLNWPTILAVCIPVLSGGALGLIMWGELRAQVSDIRDNDVAQDKILHDPNGVLPGANRRISVIESSLKDASRERSEIKQALGEVRTQQRQTLDAVNRALIEIEKIRRAQ